MSLVSILTELLIILVDLRGGISLNGVHGILDSGNWGVLLDSLLLDGSWANVIFIVLIVVLSEDIILNSKKNGLKFR